MMNFEEMKNAFETYTNTSDEVDNAQLALWLNEAQLDLAYDLAPCQSVSVDAVEGMTYMPHDNWLRIIGCDLAYRRQTDGTLVFCTTGCGKLYYRAIPASFTGTDAVQVSELPQALHYLPPLFAAARYWDRESEGDGEESNQATRWLSYYYQGKNIAKNRLDIAGCDIDCWNIA